MDGFKKEMIMNKAEKNKWSRFYAAGLLSLACATVLPAATQMI